MQLLIDIGNSTLKWATLKNKTLGESQKFGYQTEQLNALLNTHWRHLKKPTAICVSNVAGDECASALSEWTEKRWKLAPQILTPQAFDCGVTNAYQQPERLGADRWAAILATHAKFHRDAIILDCGTALTIDALAADGEHLGGLIVPGLGLMRHALTSGTRGITLETTTPAPVSVLARDTEGAVMGGTLYTMVAIIDRIVHDLAQHFRSKPTLVITGGDAASLLPLLADRYNYEPDLVLQGLAVKANDKP